MPQQHRMSMRRVRGRTSALLGALIAFISAILLVAAPISPAATIVAGVDGIKQLVPGYKDQKALDVGGDFFRDYPGAQVIDVATPQGFGILTDLMADGLVGGFNDPGYDETRAIDIAGAKAVIANAPPGSTFIFVGHSQGSDALTELIKELEADGQDTSNFTFWLAANPDRADGGLKTRAAFLPALFIPFLGVTVGGQEPPSPEYTKVIQVTREYDGFADMPANAFNVLAIANALAGTVVLHSDYDKIDLVNDPYISTTTPNGMLEDRLYTTPLVPLLMLAVQVGMPLELAKALDPALRTIIDTGYNRPDPSQPGTYPTEAVPLGFLPPPADWADDVRSVIGGFFETSDRLVNLATTGSATTPAPVNTPAPAVNNNDVVAPLTASQPSGGSQPQHLKVQVQQDVVQQPEVQVDDPEPTPLKKPEKNVFRNSFNASSGGSDNKPGGSNSFGSRVKGGDGASLGSLRDVVKDVRGAIRGALHPAKAGAGSQSSDTNDSPSTESTTSSN